MEKVPTRSIGTGPFVIGTSKVRPRVDDTFSRDEKLGIYLQLYNFEADETTKKPDGTVEYVITKTGTDEKVFEFTEEISSISRRRLPGGDRKTIALAKSATGFLHAQNEGGGQEAQSDLDAVRHVYGNIGTVHRPPRDQHSPAAVRN